MILHDYAEVYRIPCLYERMMETLHARSHTMLSALLVEYFTQTGSTVADRVVLDIVVGSGMFGQSLAFSGVKSIVGLDVIPEAKTATERQYPGVYEQYYPEGLTGLSETACLA